MAIRVGVVILPTEPWSVARHRWRHLDELGFHSAWVYDHIRWVGWPRGPWYGAWPTLAAAAGETERIRIGTLVASPNLRHPVTLAQDVMTIDELSDGRFDLGIGAGSRGPDAAVLGGVPWTPDERARRFEEFLTLLDRLLTEPVTSWSGSAYAASDAVFEPGCRQRPRVPFTVAATGPRGMALAARLATTWVTNGPASPGPPVAAGSSAAGRFDTVLFDAVARQAARLEEACTAIGRDPAGVGRMLLHMGDGHRALASLGAFEELAGRAAAAGMTDLVIHHPRSDPPFAGDEGLLAAVAARLEDGRFPA